jgi:excisionase family DNA binding protein
MDQTIIDDCLLTKRELAQKLKLSRRTIDYWMRDGRLPYLKIGKTVRFQWRQVLEKLEYASDLTQSA